MGAESRDGTTRGAGSEEASAAGIERIDGVPTCESVDAGIVYTVETLGASVELDEETAAEELFTELTEGQGFEAGTAVRKRAVESGGGTTYVVEFGPAVRDAINDDESLQGLLERVSDPGDTRDGWSVPTVEAVAVELRSSLAAGDAIQPDQIDVRLAVPEPPDPVTAVALIDGVDSVDAISGSGSFEVTVEGGESTTPLIGAGDIASVSEPSESERSDAYLIPFTLTDEARARVSEALVEVGALNAPDRHPLVARYDGETVWEGPLSRGLAASIRSGDWTGEFVISVADETTANEIAAALGIVSFTVPSDVTVSDCS
ncbi:hypothetical protein JCM30237_10440 [Halolamina litorea]